MPRGAAWVGIVGVSLSVAAVVNPSKACACDCAPITPKEAAAEASVVFVGTATQQLNHPDEGSPDPVTYVFTVERTVKGRAGHTIRVQTNNGSAACGFRFQLGDRYEVYALDADGTPFVTECGGTHRIN